MGSIRKRQRVRYHDQESFVHETEGTNIPNVADVSDMQLTPDNL